MGAEWWYNSIPLMEGAQGQIARWVLEQDWAPNMIFKKPSSYHITTVYSYDGRNDERLPNLLDVYRIRETFIADAVSVEAFDDRTGSGLVPIVLKLAVPGLDSKVALALDAFEEAGFKVSRFEGGWTPHITVAMMDPLWEPKIRVSKMTPPDGSFVIAGAFSKTGS